MPAVADTQAPQRSLRLQVLWKPVFRSRREQLVYYAALFVLVFLLTFTASALEWTALTTAVCGLGVLILCLAGIWAWLTWGRERFPLPAAEPEPAGNG